MSSPSRVNQPSDSQGNPASKTQLLDAFRILKDTLEHGIRQIKHHRDDNYADLLGANGGRAIRTYGSVFKSLGVQSREAFEGLIKSHFSHQDIQENYNEFLELESEWDDCLVQCDMKLQGTSSDAFDSPEIGMRGPIDFIVKDARTEKQHVCSLQEHVDQLQDLKTNVIIISFGPPVGARHWIDAIGCPFDVVCDEERKIYHEVGLRKSTSKVWNIDAIVYYAELVASNKPLPHKFEDVEDDPLQMGGDFILDKTRCFALIHPSTHSTDRPSLEEIITALQSISV